MLLQQAFEESARRLPGKTALVCGAQRVSYGDLLVQVRGLARALRDDGVARGDRVLVMLEPGVAYAVAAHAVLASGAVFVPLSPQTRTAKLAFIAGDTRAAALLTQGTLAAQWQPALATAASIRTCRVVEPTPELEADRRVRPWPVEGASSAEFDAGGIDQDLAALIYTSGTTGRPKGVMLTHANMRSAWASVQAYIGYREDDVVGLALPPTYSYGLYNLLMGLGVGATVVIERAAAFPAKVAQTLAKERVTLFPGVPTLFAALLGLSNLERHDLSALRLLTNAAAALPESHMRRLRSAFPQARLFLMYGLTECKRASYLPPEQLDLRPASVGRGIPNQEHWLVDEDGRRLPNGATGELVVRGSHVMRGYWERPQETAKRLRPGPIAGESVLHTGDLFRTDAEGWLYFVSRMDDMIKTRGEKVAPREVEDAIYQLESVTGCAVVGVPDDALGEAVKAYVTVAPGSALMPRDIVRHCLAALEPHMSPKWVEIVEALPRTESGKIRHASLRHPAGSPE